MTAIIPSPALGVPAGVEALHEGVYNKTDPAGAGQRQVSARHRAGALLGGPQ